jgi:2-polyprenyl-3-methyl-5-hydroxy-6-metoxy-1,4-benzoquinol methylase
MTTAAPAFDPARLEAFAGRMFGAANGALELLTVYLGERLGLYAALAERGPLSSAELAAATGTDERYVREWLEAQAACGILTVADGRFGLPPEHAVALLERESLAYVAPLAALQPALVGALRPLLEAFRSGAGVPYEVYGAEFREGQQDFTRPQYVNGMDAILASLPGVDARLRAEPPARVADLACGTAWSSISIARAYPAVTVDAIDEDAASIETARANVAAAGLSDRVRPTVQDASDPELSGRYDLVTIFEALHDMNHPVEALRAARAMLAEGGSVVVADERVAERFNAPGDEIERFNYGWSVLHCLAVAMIDEDSAGTGTVIRPDTVRAYAEQAGFASVEILPIEHDFWRFYRLAP